MKTVLVLSILLCAAFAAPQPDAEKTSKEKAPEAAVEVPQEQMVAQPEPVPEEETAPDSRNNFCPVGWFAHGSRCFLFVNTPKTWYSAEEHCNNLGGHLASVTNPREYSFLQQISGGSSTAWLGGFNLQGPWLWIDREGFYYTNWYSPLSSSSYPCIYLRNNYGWGNNRCNIAYNFICAKNPFGC
ncbi:ladderlectin-like isoform X2 [Plectropomus leopardus]|uniref:ladderlectin-like isoform X2 n=1 Tax=Plectropomus leopardus TaxID=160734 RepID=UPI001C4BF991|nr:ladderlectin-like isoform X2 [Plectropomus leopardus]